MNDADWAILDRKALGVLVNTRMREGASVTIHINQFNSVITQLGSVGIKFDDELQALLLLSSLPDSWSGTVTAVSSASGTTKFTFEGIRDLILGEDIGRRSSGDSSSALLSTEGRGRMNERERNRGRGKSQSKHREGIVCWDCKQTGHFRSQCPHGKNEVNTTESFSDNSDDVLISSVESSIDSWVMDSGTSVHATHNMKMMKNLKIGDFEEMMSEDGKTRIEKFDRQDFGWWKMQVEDLLCQKDLLPCLTGQKPEKMKDEEWADLDRKALAVIRCTLTKSVAFNIVKETTARGVMTTLSNMYEKPSASNKVEFDTGAEKQGAKLVPEPVSEQETETIVDTIPEFEVSGNDESKVASDSGSSESEDEQSPSDQTDQWSLQQNVRTSAVFLKIEGPENYFNKTRVTRE
ncbi:unnamed protein product [Cuscuta campestris]|uniref:CCHC-type domain-containing protein n=1 Tax=Cuscuta campestris TaxID=132261 RepID=A0A484MWI9_9ASTE|nr:unnamed protein product [Cuscuta campestris]